MEQILTSDKLICGTLNLFAELCYERRVLSRIWKRKCISVHKGFRNSLLFARVLSFCISRIFFALLFSTRMNLFLIIYQLGAAGCAVFVVYKKTDRINLTLRRVSNTHRKTRLSYYFSLSSPQLRGRGTETESEIVRGKKIRSKFIC